MEISIASPAGTCTKNCPAEHEYHRLISAFSHEIKNRLTLISSSLQLIAGASPCIPDFSLWQQLNQELSETIDLLKNASSFSQTSPLCREHVHIKEWIQDISASVFPLMRAREIRFQTIFDSSVRFTVVSMDAAKLKEAVTNLLLNAADAVSENPCPREILLSVVQEEDTVCLRIRDNGPGIPEEYVKTIFDPFVTHKSHGTGLGLAITKSILQQHGGTVTVRTNTVRPDTYTEFCIRLPLS